MSVDEYIENIEVLKNNQRDYTDKESDRVYTCYEQNVLPYTSKDFCLSKKPLNAEVEYKGSFVGADYDGNYFLIRPLNPVSSHEMHICYVATDSLREVVDKLEETNPIYVKGYVMKQTLSTKRGKKVIYCINADKVEKMNYADMLAVLDARANDSEPELADEVSSWKISVEGKLGTLML